MPRPIPKGMRIGLVAPKEAAAAFAARKLLQPSFRWQGVYAEEHARAFAVAGVMREDVLQIFRSEIDSVVNEGASLAEFSKTVKAQLQAKGFWGTVEVTDPDSGEIRTTKFDQRRLALIYQTNARQSQAAGRWQRIERTKERFPLVMYRTMRDEQVRASHKPWDGLALPVDHPFWETHFPPNGWNCRCTAFAVDEAMLASYRRKGFAVKTEAPAERWATFTNRQTGEVRQVPLGIDPGFDYNPGKQHLAQAYQRQAEALTQGAPDLSSASVRATVRSEPFATWQAKPQAGSAQPVAVLPKVQARRLGALQTAVTLTAKVAKALSARQATLSALDYLWVQRAIDEGVAIEQAGQAMAYLLAADGWVVVVRLERAGTGLVLTELRRMTEADARGDVQVARLLRAARGQA